MNFIKLTISLFLILTVYSAYEDCMYVESEYTIKNYYKNAEGERYTKDDGSQDYKDTKLPSNFTFIASKADDCKNRKIRAYTDGSHYYDSQKDDERKETFYTHCCYFTYDNMDQYEFNILEEKYDKNNPYSYRNEVSKKEGVKGQCTALTDHQYDNIKEYILHMQLKDGKYKNLKIDCNSYNIQFFIINLFLLFLL